MREHLGKARNDVNKRSLELHDAQEQAAEAESESVALAAEVRACKSTWQYHSISEVCVVASSTWQGWQHAPCLGIMI